MRYGGRAVGERQPHSVEQLSQCQSHTQVNILVCLSWIQTLLLFLHDDWDLACNECPALSYT